MDKITSRYDMFMLATNLFYRVLRWCYRVIAKQSYCKKLSYGRRRRRRRNICVTIIAWTLSPCSDLRSSKFFWYSFVHFNSWVDKGLIFFIASSKWYMWILNSCRCLSDSFGFGYFDTYSRTASITAADESDAWHLLIVLF